MHFPTRAFAIALSLATITFRGQASAHEDKPSKDWRVTKPRVLAKACTAKTLAEAIIGADAEVAKWREKKVPYLVAKATVRLADVHKCSGDYKTASRFYEQAGATFFDARKLYLAAAMYTVAAEYAEGRERADSPHHEPCNSRITADRQRGCALYKMADMARKAHAWQHEDKQKQKKYEAAFEELRELVEKPSPPSPGPKGPNS